MSKQSGMNEFLANHGDKVGFSLAGLCLAVFIILPTVIGGGASMGVGEFTEEIAQAERALEVGGAPETVAPPALPQPPGMLIAPPVGSVLDRASIEYPPQVTAEIPYAEVQAPATTEFRVLSAAGGEITVGWLSTMHSRVAFYRLEVWRQGETPPLEANQSQNPEQPREGVAYVPQPARDYTEPRQMTHTFTGLADNQAYSIRLRSVDDRGDPVQFVREPIEGDGNQGWLVSATSVGKEYLLPVFARAPEITSASLASVRFDFLGAIERYEPESAEDSRRPVPDEFLRVQISRYPQGRPQDRAILTSADDQHGTGWTLAAASRFADTTPVPETALVYEIRLYHVMALPDANGLPRTPTGEEIREAQYRGDVIMVDMGDPLTGSLPIQPQRVYGTQWVTFDPDAITLSNEPVLSVEDIRSRVEIAPDAANSSAVVYVSKWFQVEQGGVSKFVRMRARFEVTSADTPTTGNGNPVGGRTRPAQIDLSSVPELGASIPAEDVGDSRWARLRDLPADWREAVDKPFDFTTTFVVLGFYDLEYPPTRYAISYVEFRDTARSARDLWPFKVFPASELEKPYPWQGNETAMRGKTEAERLAAFQAYFADVVYPAAKQLRESGTNPATNRDALQDVIMYGAVDGATEPGIGPIWEFSIRHLIRFWDIERQTGFQGVDAPRVIVDPDFNELKKLHIDAGRQLGEMWRRMSDSLDANATALPAEMTAAAGTAGNDQFLVPAMVQLLERRQGRPVADALYAGIVAAVENATGEQLPANVRQPGDIGALRAALIDRLYDVERDFDETN
jgi:hypothetical protein